MHARRTIGLVVGVAAAALVVTACASSGGNGWVDVGGVTPSPGATVHITGTVHHLDIEGGLFVIRDAGGTQYNPTNLPDAFKTDGLRVEVEARRRDDMGSIGMVGPIIELVRIRRQ
jgi:predicted small secreted protein